MTLLVMALLVLPALSGCLDDGGDGNGKEEPLTVSGVLVSDPELYDYVSSTFVTGHGLSPDQTAVLISELSSAEPQVYPLNYTSAGKEFSNGTFELREEGDGTYSVLTSTPSAQQSVADTVLPASMELSNVDVTVESVSLVVDDWTVGLSSDGELAYLVLDEVPTLFTRIRIEGVVLPMPAIEDLGLLGPDMGDEWEKFTEALPDWSEYTEPARFVLAERVEYVTGTTNIEGDALEVVTPEDAVMLASALSGTSIDSEGTQELIGLVEHVNEQLVIVLERDPTMEEMTFWLVLTTRSIDREELTGIVSLEGRETAISTIASALGVSFETDEGSLRVAVYEGEDLGSNSTYQGAPVREYSQVLGSKGQASVMTDCFAMVVTYEEVIWYLENVTGKDMGYLENFAAVRNPAFALLIDEEFLTAIANEEELLDYYALAFIPDMESSEEVLRVLHLDGVVYHVGRFLGEPQLDLNLLIPDAWSDGTLDPVETSLQEIYESPDEVLAQDVPWTHVELTANLTGTTLKTVMKHIPKVRKVVRYMPLDVGVYAAMTRSGGDGIYQGSLAYVVKGEGPTFLGKNMLVRGFYLDDEGAIERLALATDMVHVDELAGQFRKLMSNFLVEHLGLHLLTGGLLAYHIEPAPLEPVVEIQEFSVEDAESGDITLLDVTAVIEKTGEFKHIGAVWGVLDIEGPEGGFMNFTSVTATLSFMTTPLVFEPVLSEPAVGKYNATLLVFGLGGDFGRLLDSREVGFEVTAGSAARPVIGGVMTEPGSPREGQTVWFNVSIDANGTLISQVVLHYTTTEEETLVMNLVEDVWSASVNFDFNGTVSYHVEVTYDGVKSVRSGERTIEVSPNEAPAITDHSLDPASPSTYEDIDVTVTAEDDTGVATVVIHFKGPGDIGWRPQTLVFAGGHWTTTIPQYLFSGTLEYYFVLTDVDGLSFTTDTFSTEIS